MSGFIGTFYPKNALNRLEAIRLAQQRVSELEQEISVLQKGKGATPESGFPEQLAKLMKRYRVPAEEVIALLMVRGGSGSTCAELDHSAQASLHPGPAGRGGVSQLGKAFPGEGLVNVNVQ